MSLFVRRIYKTIKYTQGFNIQKCYMPFNISAANISTSQSNEPSKLKIVKNKISLYGQLAKFRLSSLVAVTTGAGFICFGGPFDIIIFSATCFGTVLCAASANTFNQIIEKEFDSKMFRTRARPLPSGRATTSEALSFGIGSGLLGVGTLLSITNPIVAGLGAANIGLYAGAYTYSKRKTEFNTWIGDIT